jgi:hypothetical protein
MKFCGASSDMNTNEQAVVGIQKGKIAKKSTFTGQIIGLRN